MTGLFVVFEGGDGVGKSTQATHLERRLHAAGREVVRTFEPGDTPVGRTLRELVLNKATGDLAPECEALLFAADRAQHVAQVIAPALARGAVVICDRYVDSTLAYQGAGRTLDAGDVERINRWATHDLRPDLTVVLDLEPSAGVGVLAHRDRMEDAGVAFHERVRAGFLALARRDPQRYLVLPARAPIDELAATIGARVDDLLAARKVSDAPVTMSA